MIAARTAARRREIATRVALGAGRWRLVRQLTAEAVVLVTLSALAATLIAVWAADGLVVLLSTADAPLVLDLSPSWRVAGALAGLAVIGVAIIATPAILVGARTEARGAQTLERSGDDPARRRLAQVLSAVQIALAVVLVAGASLFVRSITHLLTLDPGFDPGRLVLLSADVLASRAGGKAQDQARAADYYRQIADGAARLPGVEAVALAWVPPISHEDGAWTQSIGIDDTPAARGANRVFFNAVSSDYFRTVGTRLEASRDFTPQDATGAPRVVIVNRTLAQQFFGDASPLGRQITIGRAERRQNLEIVAVAEDAKYQNLQEPARAIAYLPWVQVPDFLEANNLVVIARTTTPGQVVTPLRHMALAIDPAVPLRVEPMASRVADSVANELVLAVIGSFLGLVSLMLAAAAVYGTTSDLVARRTRELGVRIALGAGRRAILTTALTEAVVTTLAGCAAGVAVALAGGRLVAATLHGIQPNDPASLVAAAAALLAIAALAAYAPARRAMSLDPVEALRRD